MIIIHFLKVFHWYFSQNSCFKFYYAFKLAFSSKALFYQGTGGGDRCKNRYSS